MACWSEDLLITSVDGGLEGGDNVADGRAKSFTQALDNLFQFVVAVILFSSSTVYLISLLVQWPHYYAFAGCSLPV